MTFLRSSEHTLWYRVGAATLLHQDEAIVLGDENLLVEVYGRLQRQSWGQWRDKVPDLLGLLESNIPVSWCGVREWSRSTTMVSTCPSYVRACCSAGLGSCGGKDAR